MKKIFVDAYTNVNYGDDLFLDILFRKFPNTQFTIVANSHYDEILKKYPNVTVRKKPVLIKIIDRILRVVKINLLAESFFKKNVIKQADAVLMIGGSMFIEDKDKYWVQKLKLCSEIVNEGKKFFIVGSNFGPHFTQDYLEKHREFFGKCADVCFRDSYSYELFKDLNVVRKSTDIVFGAEVHASAKKEKTFGISVIDFEMKEREPIKKFEESYFSFLTSQIIYYTNIGWEIVLFSFCKAQGDTEACQRLIHNVRKSDPSAKIRLVEYSGDIRKFGEEFSECELVLCTRFHASILALVNSQKSIKVIYSEKTKNVLDDMGLTDSYILMDELEGRESEYLGYYEPQISAMLTTQLSDEAKKQFLEFEKYIN